MRLLTRFRRTETSPFNTGLAMVAFAGWEGENPPANFTSALRLMVGLNYLHKDVARHQALAGRGETVTVPVTKDFRLVIGPAPLGPGPSVADREDGYWKGERLDRKTGAWTDVTSTPGPWWSKLRADLERVYGVAR